MSETVLKFRGEPDSAAGVRKHSLLRRLRTGAGVAIAGLGLSLLFARRPTTP